MSQMSESRAIPKRPTIRRAAREGLLLFVIVVTAIVVGWKLFVLRDITLWTKAPKRPIFSVYSSDRIQLQLLAVHQSWYTYNYNDASLSSPIKGNEPGKEDKEGESNFAEAANVDGSVDEGKVKPVWPEASTSSLPRGFEAYQALVDSDTTLTYLTKRCQETLSNKETRQRYRNRQINFDNYFFYGPISWLDGDINEHEHGNGQNSNIKKKTCPQVSTSKEPLAIQWMGEKKPKKGEWDHMKYDVYVIEEGKSKPSIESTGKLDNKEQTGSEEEEEREEDNEGVMEGEGGGEEDEKRRRLLINEEDRDNTESKHTQKGGASVTGGRKKRKKMKTTTTKTTTSTLASSKSSTSTTKSGKRVKKERKMRNEDGDVNDMKEEHNEGYAQGQKKRRRKKANNNNNKDYESESNASEGEGEGEVKMKHKTSSSKTSSSKTRTKQETGNDGRSDRRRSRGGEQREKEKASGHVASSDKSSRIQDKAKEDGNQESIDHYRVGTIVFFENCVEGFDDVTLVDIYEYYDQVVAVAGQLRLKHPTSVVVWSKPPYPEAIIGTDLEVLHQYLIMKYLIHDHGILVIQPELHQELLSRKTQMAYSSFVNFLINAVHEMVDCLIAYETSQLQMHVLPPKSTNKELVHTVLDLYQTQVGALAKTLSEGYRFTEGMSGGIDWLYPECSVIVNSRKYVQRCLPAPDELYPLLVTGLGGSGTHNIANSLRSMGVQVRHEMIDRDGSVCWFYGGNDVYAASSYPHHARLNPAESTLFSPRFSHVIQVIRCPMRQISSFTSHLPASYDFMRSQMKAMPTELVNKRRKVAFSRNESCPRGDACNLHFSALSWVYWNNHIHTYTDVIFHTENSTSLLDNICHYLSVKQGVIKCTHDMAVQETAGSSNTNLDQNGKPTNRFPLNVLKNMVGLADSWLPGHKRDTTFVRGSKAHELHREYSLADVASLDADLAKEIQQVSLLYGYDSPDVCHDEKLR